MNRSQTSAKPLNFRPLGLVLLASVLGCGSDESPPAFEGIAGRWTGTLVDDPALSLIGPGDVHPSYDVRLNGTTVTILDGGRLKYRGQASSPTDFSARVSWGDSSVVNSRTLVFHIVGSNTANVELKASVSIIPDAYGYGESATGHLEREH